MVRPGSEMAGRTLEEIGFADRHHCVVLAVERRSRMLRERITRMPLKDGDVLLIQGRAEEVDRLRGERDVVLMDWSRQPLVTPPHKRSEEHTSELQSLMRISYAVFRLKKNNLYQLTPLPID